MKERLSLFVMALIQLSQMPVLAADEEPVAKIRATYGSATLSAIEETDRQILKKEAEFLQFNGAFREHYATPNKWRTRRVNAANFTAGALANAGDITLLSQFWRYHNDPGVGLQHKGRLEAGPAIVLSAYCTLGGLTALEGIHDMYSDYRAKQKGFDAKTVLSKGKKLKGELDALIDARQKQVNGATDLSRDDSTRLTAESHFLKDCHDLTLLEFSRLYVDSRKQKAARDLNTLGTIAVCATGAFPGAYDVIRGIQKVNLKDVGGGGIGFLISGSLLTVAPVLIYGGAAVTGKLSNETVLKAIGEGQCKIADNLARDARALEALNTSSQEQRGYTAISQLLADREALLNKERRAHKHEIVYSLIEHAALGGPQIAFGTLLTRAGYHYTNNPVKAFGDVAVGATVNEVSWALWQLQSTKDIFSSEIGFHKPVAVEAFSLDNSSLKQLQSAVQ